MKLSEIVASGLDKRADLNCSETMLWAANTVYNMGLDKPALKLAAGFGRGMGIGSTCGALTGAVMVLSHLFVKEKAHESDYISELTSEFLYIFKEGTDSISCDFLRDKYRDPETGFTPVVYKAAIILEQIIDRELKK